LIPKRGRDLFFASASKPRLGPFPVDTIGSFPGGNATRI